MNMRSTLFIVLVMVLLAIVGVSAYKYGQNRALDQHLVPPTEPPAQPPVGESPATVPPTQPTGQAYENDYMKLVVPSDWKLTEVTQTVQDQTYNKDTGVTTKVGEPKTTKTGAVSVTKSNYVLYIHPHAGQASGVAGGRFAEIAMGAPSADAVVTTQPSPPCGQEVIGANVRVKATDLIRKDLYVSSADKKDFCAVPTNGKTVWYFSYLTDYRKGYINYFKADELPGYVITMSYNSKDVNSFPAKGTLELDSALREMSAIVKTLQLKQWDKITR